MSPFISLEEAITLFGLSLVDLMVAIDNGDLNVEPMSADGTIRVSRYDLKNAAYWGHDEYQYPQGDDPEDQDNEFRWKD